ncbi:pyridoxamine 5'-phosphate oxidase family protein [Thermoflavimicrobium daqui]|uniref:Pyridoxamine 5'-phosphate oxidase family protein n=1 Tax=Thermoflavimicrobium daqui TaxID=2137476 RepID=A0A364K0H7_9BACL|nr:pyridoxamine 5'-phosphate oxidase family protein [Thermoflavimicrobium daqui]RAL20851.1 pyridoxamine 5'-phosphate oxidase family protein [Thermoflavimicrobium daqui]
MRPLRRAMKEVTDSKRIEQLLERTRVGYLGLYDEEGTYVVPLNFVWWDGKIYFHGSHEGRKIDALKKDETYCFTVAEDLGTVTSTIPAKTGTAYFSVMAFGKIEKVASLEEATDALEAMLNKYVPGYFLSKLSQTHVEKYRSGMGSPTVVYKLIPKHISAKEDPVQEENMYYTGRTQMDDLRKK